VKRAALGGWKPGGELQLEMPNGCAPLGREKAKTMEIRYRKLWNFRYSLSAAVFDYDENGTFDAGCICEATPGGG